MFVGCNDGGNNAFYVREDCMNDQLQRIAESALFVETKAREVRDRSGKLTLQDHEQVRQQIVECLWLMLPQEK